LLPLSISIGTLLHLFTFWNNSEKCLFPTSSFCVPQQDVKNCKNTIQFNYHRNVTAKNYKFYERDSKVFFDILIGSKAPITSKIKHAIKLKIIAATTKFLQDSHNTVAALISIILLAANDGALVGTLGKQAPARKIMLMSAATLLCKSCRTFIAAVCSCNNY